MTREKADFATEAELCRAFLSGLPEGWTPYPETAGFDILLAHEAGWQIGIEAKLTLNAKVISQITEVYWDCCRAGPDFRAVLVPWGRTGSLGGICSLVGLTVIQMMTPEVKRHGYSYMKQDFMPELPSTSVSYWGSTEKWHDWCPTERCKLPDYVPDVGAGHSAPVKLSEWKIKAIKICVVLERRGYVTRDDFRHFQLDHRRWLTPGVDWLAQGDRRGCYVAGRHALDLRSQHPVNYEQIASDYEKWKPPELALPPHQEALL